MQRRLLSDPWYPIGRFLSFIDDTGCPAAPEQYKEVCSLLGTAGILPAHRCDDESSVSRQNPIFQVVKVQVSGRRLAQTLSLIISHPFCIMRGLLVFSLSPARTCGIGQRSVVRSLAFIS